MIFDAVLARFEERSPLTVMARLTMQRVLDPACLDELFEAERQRQYTRELLFSSVIDVMAEVALGLKPSVYAAAHTSAQAYAGQLWIFDRNFSASPRRRRAGSGAWPHAQEARALAAGFGSVRHLVAYAVTPRHPAESCDAPS